LAQQVPYLARQKGFLVEQVRLWINPDAFQEHKEQVLAEILFAHKVGTGTLWDTIYLDRVGIARRSQDDKFTDGQLVVSLVLPAGGKFRSLDEIHALLDGPLDTCMESLGTGFTGATESLFGRRLFCWGRRHLWLCYGCLATTDPRRSVAHPFGRCRCLQQGYGSKKQVLLYLQ
jgi:hypothetical protein